MQSIIRGRRGTNKNAKVKARNAARRQFRREHPGLWCGVLLRQWPLPDPQHLQVGAANAAPKADHERHAGRRAQRNAA